MEENKKLLVRDLTVSFRQSQGLVRAVRGVSFDLNEGETLAIVGESGSGKSVTSRSIMGILAGNAIIDKGQIIYDDQDLTQISEEDFHKIRGDRIGMIFQDPMSSLNPIMKIGKQITEGMLINGKRLKNQYKRLIHRSRMEVLNTKEAIRDLKKNHRQEVKNIKKTPLHPEMITLVNEYQEQLQELKQQMRDAHTAIKDVRSVYDLKVFKMKQEKNDSEIPAAKEEYATKSQHAKQEYEQVKVSLKEFKVAHQQHVKVLKEKLSSKQEQKAKLLVERNAHIASLQETYRTELTQTHERLKKGRSGLKLMKKEAKQTVKKGWIDEQARVGKKIKDLQQRMSGSPESKNEIQRDIATLREELRRYKRVTKKEAVERAIEVMNEVGIPEPLKRLKQYPFQFSGGMRQRIVIAIALTANPDVLICDEPTTALDVTIQAQILELINRLKSERSLSVIFITHDLGVVANMSDRVAVMYAGKIVEIGTSEEIFYDPKHPYTWALLSSVPDLKTDERLVSIPGTPPNMLFPPKGDAFADRSRYALKIDFELEPPMFKVSDTHYAATWLLHPNAPKVEMPEIIQKRIKIMTATGGVEEVVN